jgi:hypothetical protein
MLPPATGNHNDGNIALSFVAFHFKIMKPRRPRGPSARKPPRRSPTSLTAPHHSARPSERAVGAFTHVDSDVRIACLELSLLNDCLAAR